MHSIIEITNFLFQPAVFFALSTVVFWAMIRFREKWTEPHAAVLLLAGAVAALGLSLLNGHFRETASQADHFPIFLMLFSTGFFTWLSLRQAVVNDRRLAQGKPPVEKETSDTMVYVWPDLVFIELIIAVIGLAALLAWSLLLRAPLEAAANPAWTPNPSKAPWYFVGLQEMLVYFDPWLAGVVIPALIILGLMAIPYIDRNPGGSGYYSFKGRKYAVMPFLFGFLVLWISLIFVGTFLRGPGWNFFGPFEPWDENKTVVLNNVNLSEFFWARLPGIGLPNNPWIRELPGLLVLAFYFGGIPFFLTRRVPFFRNLSGKLGKARYAVLLFLSLSMAFLPLKMVLQWVFHLKYIVSIPEFFFNI